ncbi:hypothetical protein [Dactylosporangium sp. NPDC006015]|uniref:hypothetical protein n=1 Tax=Dactylosporangium sp. NPDC006015 TaxID=3154576 RepID=UPI0033B8B849
MDTSDVIAIWAASGAAAISIAGVVVGAITIASARKSAREALQSARVSADEAKRSADQAEEAKRIMLDQRHDELRPKEAMDMTFSVRGNPRDGTTNLWGQFTTTRDYRVRAEAHTGNSRSQLSVDLLLRAGACDVMIEMWPEGRERSNTKFVVLKFWPPEDVDETEHWNCRCGRGVHYGDGTGPGHWEVRVPVDYQELIDGPELIRQIRNRPRR